MENIQIVEVTHSGLTPGQTLALLAAVAERGLCVTCRREPAEGNNVTQCGACVDLHARAAKATL